MLVIVEITAGYMRHIGILNRSIQAFEAVVYHLGLRYLIAQTLPKVRVRSTGSSLTGEISLDSLMIRSYSPSFNSHLLSDTHC